MLKEILREGFKHSSLSEASQNILKVIKNSYGVSYVTIYINGKRGLYTIASNVNNKFLNDLENYSNELIGHMNKFISKTKISKGGNLSYLTARERNVCFSNFTPLHWENDLIGAILIENVNSSEMKHSKNRIKLYNNIIENIALILQNVIHYDNIIAELMTDGLTQVYNRRYIEVNLPEEINIHENLNLSFAIAIMDIDFFKKFNDTYGHQFGDTTLKQVSSIIKENLRENDWIARYGGEEFLIFISKTNKKNAYSKIDKLREIISNSIITDGKIKASVTASFGLAIYERGLDYEKIIGRADKALYKSKEDGRNKVTVYTRDIEGGNKNDNGIRKIDF